MYIKLDSILILKKISICCLYCSFGCISYPKCIPTDCRLFMNSHIFVPVARVQYLLLFLRAFWCNKIVLRVTNLLPPLMQPSFQYNNQASTLNMKSIILNGHQKCLQINAKSILNIKLRLNILFIGSVDMINFSHIHYHCCQYSD